MIGARCRAAAWVLAASVPLCVLAVLPSWSRSFDRYCMPKEALLIAVSASVAALLLSAQRQLRLALTDVALAVFILLGLVSTAMAANSWLAWRGFALSTGGVAIFWSARCLVGVGYRSLLLIAIAVAMSLAAGSVVLEAHGVLGSLSMQGRAPGGTVGNRNFMSHALVVGTPAVLALFFAARRRSALVLAAGALTLTVHAIVLGRSRGAWLASFAMAAVLLVVLAASRRGWPKARIAAVVGVVALAIGSAALVPNALSWSEGSTHTSTLERIGDYKSGTGRGRIIQYRNTLEIAAANPVFGVGPGNWSVAYPAVADPHDPSHKPNAVQPVNRLPNSDWLGVAAERGLVALALLLLVAAALLWRAIRGLRADESGSDERARCLLLLISLIGIALVGLFDAVMLRPLPLIVGAITVATLAPSLPAATRRVRWPVRTVAIAGVIGLAIFADARLVREMNAMALTRTSRALPAAVAMSPGDYRLRIQLASRLVSRGRCARANAHLDVALRLYPHSLLAKRLRHSCQRSRASTRPTHEPLPASPPSWPKRAADALVRAFTASSEHPVTASPDRSRVLIKHKTDDQFVLRVIDRKTGSVLARHQSADTQMALTWRPDGKAIAFLAARGGDRRYRLHLWDLSGPPRVLPTPITRSAGLPLRWSPTSHHLAYVDTNASRLIVVDVASGRWEVAAEDVSPRGGFAWSPTGDSLVVARRRGGLVVASRRGTVARQIAAPEGRTIRAVAWAPDAFYVAARGPADEHERIVRIDAGTAATKTLSRPSGDVSDIEAVGGAVVYSVRARGDKWLERIDQQGGHIIGPRRGRANLRGMDAERRVLFVHHVARDRPGALFALDMTTKKLTALWDRRGSDRAALGRAVSIPSAGATIPAFLYEPDGKRRSKAIMWIHGGPRLHRDRAWRAEIQAAVRAGFVVLDVNYRGSTGYGQRFERMADAQPRAARVADIVAAAQFLARRGSTNIVAIGSSYGAALLADVVAAHPTQFAGGILVSTPRLLSTVRRAPATSTRVVAFHGGNDNVLSPRSAWRQLKRRFGPTTPFHVLPNEGHQFHQVASLARLWATAFHLLSEGGDPHRRAARTARAESPG